MTCAEKERFVSRKRAAKVRDQINAKGVSSARLRVYQCPICRGYHLTSHERGPA